MIVITVTVCLFSSMAEADAAPEPWRPGQPVQEHTKLVDLAAVVAFGQQDETFNQIALLLKARNCISVSNWQDWQKSEFLSLVRAHCPTMKRHRNAYLAGFESMTGHKLCVESGINAEGPFVKVKKQTGGDMMGMSNKQATSEGFNASKWLPDALVYSDVPKKEDAEYISEEQEKLYLDKLWLAANVLAIECRRMPPRATPITTARLRCSLAIPHNAPSRSGSGGSRALHRRVLGRRHDSGSRQGALSFEARTVQAEAPRQAERNASHAQGGDTQ